MREANSILAHVDVLKTNEPGVKFFYYYLTKKCTRSINERKTEQKYLFIISLNSKSYS